MVVELAKVVERVRSCHACKFSVCVYVYVYVYVCVCVCARVSVCVCVCLSVTRHTNTYAVMGTKVNDTSI